MEVIILDNSMRNKWEDFVYSNIWSIAWQSHEWNDVVRKHYKAEFYPLAAMESSKIIGILPLYSIKNIKGKTKLISVPYAVAGGIVSDSEEARSLLLEKAIEISRQYNSCNITLKQYKIKINGELRTDDNYYNRELELTSDMSELWRKISEKNRKKIGESGKYNLVLEYPSQNIEEFYSLLLTHQHQNGIPCVKKKWIEDLVRFKMYFIALLKQDDKYVAGTMIKIFKKTVSFPFTCLKVRDGESSLFVYSLYWQLIEKFASEGIEICHSGRIPNNEQTDEYRLGWGGTKYNYYYQYYPVGTGSTEFSNKRGKKRDLFTPMWKKLPLSIARLLGPYVVKQFP